MKRPEKSGTGGEVFKKRYKRKGEETMKGGLRVEEEKTERERERGRIEQGREKSLNFLERKKLI